MVATVQATSDAKETPRLISSAKVAGRRVENAKRDSLGSIEDVMIDKINGKVAYAVLKYGSFLGMGGKLFALPWDVLKYDAERDAYLINIPEERLKNAPSFDEKAWPDLSDRAYGKQVYDYYGTRGDWYM